MLLSVELFNGSTLIGILGIITFPMMLIALAWATRKTQETTSWKNDAAAAREGMEICDKRLRQANEWNATLQGKYDERERVIQALEERTTAQAEHIAHRDEQISTLLDRTPEKLWEALADNTEALKAHAEEAGRHWTFERDILTLNQKILEELRDLRKESGNGGTG